MRNKKFKKDSKKNILIIVVILIVILFLNLIINLLENKQQLGNDEKATIGFSSIEEILNKYNCKFIKETKSKDLNYTKDLYIIFKYNTFDQNESKKRYYENVISYLSEFINANYRIIDEEKNLLIEVKKQVNIDGIDNFVYIINGEENYFSNQESKINIENYNEIENTDLEINSNILNQLNSSNWKNNVNFGYKDSDFDNYEIYFDEGIEVRKISGKVYNVVFTKNYNEEIVNGIKVGTDFSKIIQKLGEPTYGNKDGFFIGYKNSEIYIFFLENAVSIYKNETAEMTKFEKILIKYVDKQIDIKEFMNELTYLWPDYEEYTYNSRYIYINYPTKGIRIQMTSDTSLGITIYNNCNITENISKLIKEGKISSNLKEDLNEKTLDDKINREDGYKYISLLNDGEEINQTISNLFYHYLEVSEVGINRVLFISKDGENPNTQINEKISGGFFINDNIFVYSIQNKGIYAFDVISRNKSKLVEGQEEFLLKEFKDGILKYDNKQIDLIME